MGECIDATPEVLERHVGEAIAHRGCAIDKFKGLGPPDLCVLEKHKKGWFAEDTQGYYHWVIGVEPVNAAAICFYFNSLLKHQESARWFLAHCTVKKGIFCCWNPFSRLDCRVEMDIPGSVHEYAINIEGDRVEMTDQLWKVSVATHRFTGSSVAIACGHCDYAITHVECFPMACLAF